MQQKLRKLAQVLRNMSTPPEKKQEKVANVVNSAVAIAYLKKQVGK